MFSLSTCTSKSAQRALFFLIAGFLVCLNILALSRAHDIITEKLEAPISSDFYKFFYSAHALNIKNNPYWTSSNTQCNELPICHNDKLISPNLNPPIFAILIQPFTQIPLEQSLISWYIFIFLAPYFAFYLLFRLTTDKTHAATYSSIAAPILFSLQPTTINFHLGQVGTILFLLIALFLFLHEKYSRYAGIPFLAIACAIKPFLLTIPALALFRQRTTTLFFTAIFAALLIAPTLMHGFEIYENYSKAVKSISWISSNWNGSFWAQLERSHSYLLKSNTPHLYTLLLIVLTLSTPLVVLLLFITRLQSTPGSVIDLTYAGSSFGLLLSPLGWNYYTPLLLGLAIFNFFQINSKTYLALALLAFFLIIITLQSEQPYLASTAHIESLDTYIKYSYTHIATIGFTMFALILQYDKQSSTKPMSD